MKAIATKPQSRSQAFMTVKTNHRLILFLVHHCVKNSTPSIENKQQLLKLPPNNIYSNSELCPFVSYQKSQKLD